MSRYILDTNILTDLEYPETPAYHMIMDKIGSLSEESEVFFSIISAYEYQHGIAKASESLAENLKNAWETFLDIFDVLPLTLKARDYMEKLKHNTRITRV